MGRMPAAFIGHGSPMNALESNRYTEAWAAYGRAMTKPTAILAISAHWFVNATAVTSAEHPRVIHDFYGFPRPLFDFTYPAPGSPELAHRVAALVDPVWVGLDEDSWGIDHGTWSVLAHMFPAADVPVVQLSIDAAKPVEYHVDLGRRLAPLRDEGVLIVGSGNVVHNLRAMTGDPDVAYDWAQRFDDDVRDLMVARPDRFEDLTGHDDYPRCAPTADHFLPLAYVAGLAEAASDKPEVLVEGTTMGSVSMTAYGLAGDAA